MARHKLPTKYTAKCNRAGCHHGKAAHPEGFLGGAGACRMKHCKCKSFVYSGTLAAESQ